MSASSQRKKIQELAEQQIERDLEAELQNNPEILEAWNKLVDSETFLRLALEKSRQESKFEIAISRFKNLAAEMKLAKHEDKEILLKSILLNIKNIYLKFLEAGALKMHC
jgi:hypothetical protein